MTTQNCGYPVVRILLWLISMMAFDSASAQNQKTIDSLLSVLPHRYGADKYTVFHWLAAEYADWDNEKAFEFAESAEKIAYATGDSSLIVKSQRLKGQILVRLGRPQEVLLMLDPFIHNFNLRKHTAEHLIILNLMGGSHMVMSQFDKALDFYFQTYETAKRVGDSEYVAISLENIGVIYYKLKDYREALSYMLQSSRLRRDLRDETYLSSMNVSLCYAHLADFVNARKYLAESIGVCGANCPARYMVHIKYASGLIHYGLRKFGDAEREFLLSLELAREAGDFRMQLDNIYLLAKIYIGSIKLNKARQLLEEGELIIKEGVPYNMETIKVYSELAELYGEVEDFKRASWYQSRYIALKDSIYDERMTTALMRIESQYLEKENKEKLAAQDEVILLKEQMIDRQAKLNIVSGFLILIGGILLVGLFMGFRQKKRFNRILSEKIIERTLELERNQSILFSALQQQRTETQRLYKAVLESSKTFEGLCHAATMEISDSRMADYIGNIKKCLAQLLLNVHSVMGALK
jgi:tetratricopeptide (TPR) repeat protein